jgi:hypothetical protein
MIRWVFSFIELRHRNEGIWRVFYISEEQNVRLWTFYMSPLDNGISTD